MSITLRRLVTDDEARVEAFLAGTAERTLFLRSNLSRVGLVDDGAPFGGTYAGAFDGDTLVAVGALYWNGNVVVAPGPYAARAAAHAVSLSGRTVNGILGPYEEVVESRAALGLRDAATSFFSKEVLYSLQLSELVVPLASTGTRVVVREPHPDELAALLEWRILYAAETTHGEDTPETRASDLRATKRAGIIS